MYHLFHAVLSFCEVALPHIKFLHTCTIPPQTGILIGVWKDCNEALDLAFTIGTGDFDFRTCVKMSGGYITVFSSVFAVTALVLAVWTLVFKVLVQITV